MDTFKKEIPQRWVEASTFPSTPAPEIVRTFISELTSEAGMYSLIPSRMFRSYGVDDSAVGASKGCASSAPSDEENPGDVGFVPEGAD